MLHGLSNLIQTSLQLGQNIIVLLHNHMCILAKAQPRSGGIGANQHQQRLYKNDYMQEQENVKQ